MSESKNNSTQVILQLIGSIIGILIFALGGVLLINPLYFIIWAAQGGYDSFFPFTEFYFPIVTGTMLGLGLMALGIVLILWSRPR